uniref:4-hydroxy-3-methylbut-2-en-1-yl diphosphate synthase (ferredoxin), chloroplastic n=1 Tax=Pyrodinium bahamense TaxID=73915 RepID=A0A7R9ZZ80_9DINO
MAAGAAAAALAAAMPSSRGRKPQRHRHKVAATCSKVARPALPPGGYCEAAEKCMRRRTRTITIGDVKVGSEHPIATQTMTTTLTHDVEATVAQIKKCADAGVDIVRVTVQGMREAKACEHIKRRLLEDGYRTPIVADIHFTPKVALVCADFVDKVRVNPGNFADGRKSFDTIDELKEEDIKEAQATIEEAFAPLVLKLKEQNKALRIGVNHGSLAERILFQYGDSPEGMVASAVEFGEICRKYDYHNFLFSMKSSNPQVMVNAYRQLAREMYKLGWDYPLHLGVTEAGGGADGRIKSAVGIGALLLDGLGDTIRVSLTEDPEFEAKPCIALRQVAESAWGRGVPSFEERSGRRDGHFSRRKCDYPLDVPLNMDGSVLTLSSAEELTGLDDAGLCQRFGLRLRADGDIQKDWKSIDTVLVEGEVLQATAEKLKLLLSVPVGVLCRPASGLPEGVTWLHNAASVEEPLEERLGGHALLFEGDEPVEVIEKATQNAKPRLILLKPKSQEGITFLARRFMSILTSLEASKAVPVMFWFSYPRVEGQDEDDVVVRASSDFGSLFVDGLGEGLLWDSEGLGVDTLRESSFNLLQASRMRISKTEFISCPSCGRTLFNLQETTAKIQARTGHLPGVRIAVMGCIVNGPGEMADADFGYVGSGVGKVDLYVNYDCVQRGIPSEVAVDKLVDLIKEHGRWQDPPEEPEVVEAEVVGAVAAL